MRKIEKKKRLISINIPIYKCENSILKCLESVKNQTYKNFEIVLVNDQTPDNSIKFIEQFIEDNPSIDFNLIHHDKNYGLSVVRNTGIENSKGEYIYFLDSDDEITPNCIQLLINNILQYKTDMVIAQNRWINTFNNSIKDYGFSTGAEKKIYTDNNEIFKAYCLNKFPITSWNKLIRLDFIKNNKIYFIPGLYAQDELWMFHIMEKINSLSIIDEITYNYYLHANSVIFNRTKKNFDNYLTILSYFKNSFEMTNSKTKKKLIKVKVIDFKNMVMIMQWKALKNDFNYLEINYKKMKQMPSLSFFEYFDLSYSKKIKKLNFLQNLPSHIGAKIFVKKFN